MGRAGVQPCCRVRPAHIEPQTRSTSSLLVWAVNKNVFINCLIYSQIIIIKLINPGELKVPLRGSKFSRLCCCSLQDLSWYPVRNVWKWELMMKPPVGYLFWKWGLTIAGNQASVLVWLYMNILESGSSRLSNTWRKKSLLYTSDNFESPSKYTWEN